MYAIIQIMHLVGTAAWGNYRCVTDYNISLYSQTGESLVEGGHYASDEIESRVEELFTKWEELLEATDSRKIGLEQALSLVHFNRKVIYVLQIYHELCTSRFLVLYVQRIPELIMNECQRFSR